ncbi:MAG: hypothetical protein HY869_17470 [Chloroflexi bacterium]|nr:hypothetical protein [Chloroflexota bacterium]
MKNKTLLAVILFSLTLASCAPVPTPAPTNTPTPTATVTSTTVPATSTPQTTAIVSQTVVPTSTPFINENASEDCFLNIDVIPEKTEMDEVISTWGNPSSKLPFGTDYENWYFDFIGTPQVNFKKQVIDTVNFSLKNCSLEKIIAKLGSPEKVEVTVLISCIDLSASYIQYFHFTSLGFAFYRLCDETQNCFTFQAGDTVNGKEFYSKDKVIEDSTGFNMASYVYNWHGFGIDVEKIENKIKDFATITPTP